MRSTFEVLGLIGIAISVIGYLPQIGHLVAERCSAGISTRSWQLWLLSSLLVGSLAVYRSDYVFVTLASSSTASAVAILFLARRYRGNDCRSLADHPLGASDEATQPATTIAPPSYT